ncbi:MAG TPA: hypothetical protein DCR97_01425 [Deltaproteobacteria bacterium]|nr:hypothetical protein [Deltaproteobacteria bacterium]
MLSSEIDKWQNGKDARVNIRTEPGSHYPKLFSERAQKYYSFRVLKGRVPGSKSRIGATTSDGFRGNIAGYGRRNSIFTKR